MKHLTLERRKSNHENKVWETWRADGRLGRAQVAGRGLYFLARETLTYMTKWESADRYHPAVPCLSETGSLDVAWGFSTLENQSLPGQKKSSNILNEAALCPGCSCLELKWRKLSCGFWITLNLEEWNKTKQSKITVVVVSFLWCLEWQLKFPFISTPLFPATRQNSENFLKTQERRASPPSHECSVAEQLCSQMNMGLETFCKTSQFLNGWLYYQ